MPRGSGSRRCSRGSPGAGRRLLGGPGASRPRPILVATGVGLGRRRCAHRRSEPEPARSAGHRRSRGTAPDARYLLAGESPNRGAFLRDVCRPRSPSITRAPRAREDVGRVETTRSSRRASRSELGLYPVVSWGPGDEERAARPVRICSPGPANIPRSISAASPVMAPRAASSSRADTGPRPPRRTRSASRPSPSSAPTRTGATSPERNRPYRGAALGYDQTASVETVAAARLVELREDDAGYRSRSVNASCLLALLVLTGPSPLRRAGEPRPPLFLGETLRYAMTILGVAGGDLTLSAGSGRARTDAGLQVRDVGASRTTSLSKFFLRPRQHRFLDRPEDRSGRFASRSTRSRASASATS